jgi:hypothetical protein
MIEYPGELQELLTLTVSPEWRAYIRILEKHKEYLQGEVIRFVRENDLMKAYGSVCKIDDLSAQLKTLNKRIDDLKKEARNARS